MSNLYTTPIFNHSYRIQLLSELKKEYGTDRRDWEKIKSLKDKLARWEKRQLLKQPQKKHYKSVFNSNPPNSADPRGNTSNDRCIKNS